MNGSLDVVVELEEHERERKPLSLRRCTRISGKLRRRDGSYEFRSWDGVYVLRSQPRQIVDAYYDTLQFGRRMRNPHWTWQQRRTTWRCIDWRQEARRTACAALLALRQRRLDRHVAAHIAALVAGSYHDPRWNKLMESL